jgi:ABC-type branched-subunit amino acid transport system substrate-binding protein
MSKRLCTALVFLILLLLISCNVNRIKSNAEDTTCGLRANECDLCSDLNGKSAQFIVAVVGDGVSDDYPAMSRQYPVNRAQGEAMWNGIQLAYEKSEVVSQVKDLIKLKTFDDGGSGDCARNIAECIYHNPCVLAVIGHATSGTTSEAAETYYKARIPVIMPIATSPRVFYPPNKKEPRYNNLFRLPPGDDQFQAYALGYYAIEKLKASRIYLFGDTSPDAETYSGPIYDKLDKEVLGSKKLYADRVSRTGASNTASIIKQANPDLVIFTGYWSNFALVLGALTDLYKDQPKRPKILLSDGCLSKDTTANGFDVFVTFPAPDINDTNLNQTSDLKLLKDLINRQHYQSYEIYGYDALQVLAQAILDSRRAGVSRASVIQSLQSRQSFQGAAFTYHFDRGENIQSNYYVFDVAKKSFETITSQEMNSFKTRRPGPQ